MGRVYDMIRAKFPKETVDAGQIENLQEENNQLKASCALLLLLLSGKRPPQTPAEIFGSRLRELRQSRGLTQESVAKKLNISSNGLSQYENGRREAPFKLILAFADVFDVSIDYLFGRADS